MENKPRERRKLSLKNEAGEVIGDLMLASIVDVPAIEGSDIGSANYMMFSKLSDDSGNKYALAKTFVDGQEKRILTGPALRPNINITRKDKITGEVFDGYFIEEDIEEAAMLFSKNQNTQITNYNHTGGMVYGVNAFESWIIVDPANDKANALGFQNLQKGDWYISYHIENESFWQFLKEKGEGGFSIEGFFHEQLDNLSSINLEKIESDENYEESIVEAVKAIAFNTSLGLTELQKEIIIEKFIKNSIKK